MFQHIQFARQVYWVMAEGANKSDCSSCFSFCVLFQSWGVYFCKFFERKLPFLYSSFMRYMVALSLYMPLSPCALVVMLKDMDYACLKLRQVCIFKILCFRVIFCRMFCFQDDIIRMLCFRTILAGCRVS